MKLSAPISTLPSINTLLGVIAALSLPVTAGGAIVNIDFEGIRPGDVGTAGLFVGPGGAGGGIVFNGVAADSTGGDDNLTVSATNLQDSFGTPTTISFTITPVGGDHEPSQGNEPASLYDDYIFNHSAGNAAPASGSPFTISGLGSAATADLYFYLSSFNSGGITVTGGPAGSGGTFNGLSALFFDDVPVSGGSITGLFGVNGVGVLGGFTIDAVPEPTSFGLLAPGVLGLVGRRRRA